MWRINGRIKKNKTRFNSLEKFQLKQMEEANTSQPSESLLFLAQRKQDDEKRQRLSGLSGLAFRVITGERSWTDVSSTLKECLYKYSLVSRRHVLAFSSSRKLFSCWLSWQSMSMTTIKKKGRRRSSWSSSWGSFSVPDEMQMTKGMSFELENGSPE